MIDEDGDLSEGEKLQIRKSIARDNLQVFGIKLSPNFFKKGNLTDDAVIILEKLAPTISMQKIISPNVIGIGFLSKAIQNLPSIISGTTFKKRKNIR